MTNDGAHGFFGDGVDYLVHGGGELFDEVAHKFRNIRFSFAERWQRNWKNIQAIIQILPEFTVTDHLPQVLIGRRDDTNIDARGTGAAYSLELALLEHTEQLRRAPACGQWIHQDDIKWCSWLRFPCFRQSAYLQLRSSLLLRPASQIFDARFMVFLVPELARPCAGALPRPASTQDSPATVRLLPRSSRRWHALHRKSAPHLEWLDLWRGARFSGVVGRTGLRRRSCFWCV